MNVLVVVAHPDPSSFSHALADAAASAALAQGHELVVHDLSGAGAAGLRTDRDDLARAEGIVVVHPSWKERAPALLEGWIERVVRGSEGGLDAQAGLLRARTAVVLDTFNTPPPAERDRGDPLDAVWRRCGLRLAADVRRRTYGAVAGATPVQRSAWLSDAFELVGRALRPS